MITYCPMVNMLGGYYCSSNFCVTDVRSNMASADQPSVMDEAYKEFVMQLASWDTRREFAANRLLQTADGGQQQSRCGVAG